MPAKKEIKKTICALLAGNPEIAAVYLFGSLITGKLSEESDVDVALLLHPGKNLAPMERLRLQEALSDSTGREIDLVCLNQASPILAMQVLSKGEKILEKNPRETAEFQMKATSLYYDFKRIRKPLERNFLKGKLYG